MIVWVVTASVGQYSDKSEWVEGVALSIDDALAIVRRSRGIRGFKAESVLKDIRIKAEAGVTSVLLGESAGYSTYEPTGWYAQAFEIDV